MAAGIIGALTAAPALIDGISHIIDRFVPDPAQKAQAALDMQKLVADREVEVIRAATETAKAQIGVNLAEAQGNDRYSSRWRPTFGWIGAAGIAYQFVVAPVLTWITGIVGVALGAAIPPAPVLDITNLMVLVTGLLGFGVQRTIERTQGVPGAMPGGVAK